MTDTASGGAPAPAVPSIPSVGALNAGSAARWVAGLAVGALIAHHLIPPGWASEATTDGAAGVLALGSAAWIWWKNHQAKAKVVAALAAPAFPPPPPAKG